MDRMWKEEIVALFKVGPLPRHYLRGTEETHRIIQTEWMVSAQSSKDKIFRKLSKKPPP